MSELESTESDQLLRQVAAGDRHALGKLLDMHRGYIRKLVEARLDPALSVRVDPSDVVQETQLLVAKRIANYLERRPASFRVWLRSTTLERLIDLRRRHTAGKRSIGREVHFSDASSLAIARGLVAKEGPSQNLQRRELASQVREIYALLSKNDQEILELRYLDELTNAEASEALGIELEAARKRLGRAVARLTILLREHGIRME